MKRTAAAATPSPSQPAAAKEAWGTLVLQMNAEDTQTFLLYFMVVYLLAGARAGPSKKGAVGRPKTPQLINK